MAVFTPVSDDDLDSLLSAYELGSVLSFKGIAEGIENTNYLLVTDRGTFIVTLFEKRVAATDLPFFLALLDHLSRAGLPCPTPVIGRDGRCLRELCGRPAAIVSFLTGVSRRRPRVGHCAAAGAVLAQLHRAGADFAQSRANGLSIADWRALFDRGGAALDTVSTGLHAEIGAELDFLERHWPDHLPRGIIHADLFPDNVLFQEAEVSGLIDFYFSCVDLHAYDLAICLNAWCFEPDGTFNATKAQHMVHSYHRVRPLDRAEWAALPVLCRGSALRFLLTRLFDHLHHPANAWVTPKSPLECLTMLRFHRNVASPTAYGRLFDAQRSAS